MENIKRRHYDLIMLVKKQVFNPNKLRDEELKEDLYNWIVKYYYLDTRYVQDHYRIIKKNVLDILETHEKNNKGDRFTIADRLETETLNIFYSVEVYSDRSKNDLSIYDYFMMNYLTELSFIVMLEKDHSDRFKIVDE